MAEFQDEIIDPPESSQNQSDTSTMTLRVIVNYIISDISKKPRSFKIGLFTTYIVITFLGLLQCVIQLSPLIFLQLAENSTGDTDLQITPRAAENATNFQLINMTDLQKYTKLIPEFYDISPRWLLMCKLRNNKQIVKNNQELTAYLLLLDSQQENSIGVGRRFDSDIISQNEIYVSESALRGLNASIGDTLQIHLDLLQLLQNVGINSEGTEFKQSLNKQFKMFMNQTIMQISDKDIQNQEYNVSELQSYARRYQTYVKGIEFTQFTKSIAQGQAKNYIREQDGLNENAYDQIDEIIDFMFARNMTRDAEAVNKFLDRVALIQDVITISEIEDGLFDILMDIVNFDLNVKVHGGIDAPKGKWAEAMGMVVYMDYKDSLQLILDAIIDKLDIVVKNNKKNNKGMTGAISELIPVNDTRIWVQNATVDIKLQEYALLASLLYNKRSYIYENPDIVKQTLIDTSNQFFTTAGYDYPISITSPLGASIKLYHLMKNFIENLLGVATIILLMLSILLIYSLMIGDVEEKTYEFGMLRALGFQKSWLIILLLIQGLTFAIPGLLLGLITCYLLNCAFSMIIFDMSLLFTSYSIPFNALAFSVCLGIFMPLISNILPIQKALSKTLRDSLDLFHRVVNDLLVTVVKLEKMGISANQTFCATLLISMGFISYYIIPMNIIFQNIRGAIIVINLIFITMVIGITVLINLFQQKLERFVIRIILLVKRSDRNLKAIIINNLHGHGNRNFKTTLMYSLGLAFIIFTGAQFALQTRFMKDFIRTSLTSDIIVFDASLQSYGLDEYKFRQHMIWEQEQDSTLISGFTFSALQLNDIPGVPRWFFISPLSHFPRRRIRLHAIEKHYLEVITNEYYYPTQYDTTLSDVKYLDDGVRDGVYDLYNKQGNVDLYGMEDVQSMKTNANALESFKQMIQGTEKIHKKPKVDTEINVIIPEGYRYEGGVDVETPALLRVYQNQRRMIERRMKIKHMAAKIPNNDFSAYRTVALFGEGLITMEDAQMLLNEILFSNNNQFTNHRTKDYFDKLPKNLTYGLPKDVLLIKFNRTTTKEERMDFSNRLRNYFTNDQIYLFDSITMIETSKDFFDYLQLFNIVVAAIALTLSFFLLLVSFISNVRNNSWEIGILRAIGLTETQVAKVFIYEAISLITASGFIGTLIGLVIATTFTFQIVAFSEFQFKFAFPTSTFVITFIGGLTVAIYASYLATKSFKKSTIASIVKGQT